MLTATSLSLSMHVCVRHRYASATKKMSKANKLIGKDAMVRPTEGNKRHLKTRASQCFLNELRVMASRDQVILN